MSNFCNLFKDCKFWKEWRGKKEEFLTALFIEVINFFSFPDIINEATHIYVLGEFELSEATSKNTFKHYHGVKK